MSAVRALAALSVGVIGAAAGSDAGAQVVRGTVAPAATDTAGGRAMADPAAGRAGLLVMLVDTAGGAAVARARVGPGGRFVLAAPMAGAYRVVATHVGYRPVRSAVLTLAAGDTAAVTLAAPVDAVRLTEVLVQARRLCEVRPAGDAPAAALWNAARTTLEAAAAAESTLALGVRRYTRTYTPDAARLVSERVGPEESVRGPPFAALPADALAGRGFVRPSGRDAEFLAPDARTLLSDAFAAGHCFEVGVVTDSLVALDFEPVAERDNRARGADVAGTLWLVTGTGALRSLTFRYTDLPPGLAVADAGGRLEFGQLDGGAWVVARWGIRAALLDRAPGAAATGVRLGGGMFGSTAAAPPRVTAIREVGGEVVGATDLLGGAAVAAERPPRATPQTPSVTATTTATTTAATPATVAQVDTTRRRVAMLPEARVTAVVDRRPTYAVRTATGLTLDRAAIEERRARTVSDLFVGLPGVRVSPGGIVTVPRVGSGPLLNSELPCVPVYYVDGVRMAPAASRGTTPAGAASAWAGAGPFGGVEVGGGGYLSPLLGLTPDDLEQVAVYTSLGGVPPQYASNDATCGVIVARTRRGSAR